METQIDCLDEMFKKNLEERIKSLITTLEQELESLQRNPKGYRPSGCGIVQNSGANIDELCIKIATLKMIKQ